MSGASDGGGEFVTRAEYQRLEVRLRKAEATLRTTEATMKMMQQQMQQAFGSFGVQALSSMGQGAMGGMGYGQSMTRAMDRSRSPFERSPPAVVHRPQLQGTGMAEQSAEDFASENGIDDKCLEALLSQPEEVQHYVISQGPVEGRNPSAMVISRITKCRGGSGGAVQVAAPTQTQFPLWTPRPSKAQQAALTFQGEDMVQQVEEFIIENNLDEKCSESLRSAEAAVQAAVMNQGPAAGRNPSAMVVGRIMKAQRGEI